MASVLKTQGPDIFRVKGVLAVAHAKKKYVYEAVGWDETCDGTFGEDWGKDEVRESKLVFIGKNLDETVLKAGFASCAATAQLDPPHPAKKLEPTPSAGEPACEAPTRPRSKKKAREAKPLPDAVDVLII